MKGAKEGCFYRGTYALEGKFPLFIENPRREIPGNRIAPVLLAQDREMLPPSHRTGRQLYTLSFRHTEFSETQA